MDLNKRVLRGSVIVFYLLIGLEIIIMISPFATYFYGVYGPLLNLFCAYAATAWLTGFFLPHAVISKSVLLNFINSIGPTLFSLGMIAFLVCAVQIYWAKFRRKGMVTGLLYRWIRHPQYLFLSIAGLGLLLFWPRFFVLTLYISMLFVYYLLARHEEQRMLAHYGDSYRAYMQRTAMFIPGKPGGKLFRILFGWIKSPRQALALSYVLALVLAIVTALGLRSYTISQTAIVYLPEERSAAISISPRSEQSLREILEIAYEDSTVAVALENFRQQGHKGFLVHVMSQHYMMQGLFVQPAASHMHSRTAGSLRRVMRFILPFLSSRSHHETMGAMAGAPVRLIFSQLTWPDGKYAPFHKALAFTVKHLPLLKVDLDPAGRVVQAVEQTSLRNFWGKMPMPAY
ncbi:MAG: methyltransferase family protein [Bacteroidota bacterium]